MRRAVCNRAIRITFQHQECRWHLRRCWLLLRARFAAALRGAFASSAGRRCITLRLPLGLCFGLAPHLLLRFKHRSALGDKPRDLKRSGASDTQVRGGLCVE